jgi:hypothetical protein
MNEFERRLVDLALNHRNLARAAQVPGGRATIEPYVYAASCGSAAAPLVDGSQNQMVIPIQADSHFVITYITAVHVLPGNPIFVVSAHGDLQITDTGNGATLYSRANPSDTLVGGGDFSAPGLPFLLPVPRIVLPNTNIKVDYTHRGPDSNGYQIAFFGSRVYGQ